MNTYHDTHVSAIDGSEAMLVSTGGGRITLVNEAGDEWTDPTDMWIPVS